MAPKCRGCPTFYFKLFDASNGNRILALAASFNRAAAAQDPTNGTNYSVVAFPKKLFFSNCSSDAQGRSVEAGVSLTKVIFARLHTETSLSQFRMHDIWKKAVENACTRCHLSGLWALVCWPYLEREKTISSLAFVCNYPKWKKLFDFNWNHRV